jgi:hypothetical protein
MLSSLQQLESDGFMLKVCAGIGMMIAGVARPSIDRGQHTDPRPHEAITMIWGDMPSDSWLDRLFGVAEIFLLARNTIFMAFVFVPIVTAAILWLRGTRALLALRTARISLIAVGKLLLTYVAYIAVRYGGNS